jgi:hypothetical protein
MKGGMGRGRSTEALQGAGGIVRVSTESERKVLVRATTRSAHAKSGFPLEKGSRKVYNYSTTKKTDEFRQSFLFAPIS